MKHFELLRTFSNFVILGFLFAPMVFLSCSHKLCAPVGENPEKNTHTVTPGIWVSTGLFLEKGQNFRVESSGEWKYKNNPSIKIGADGGYWGWFKLQGKIGSQLIELGAKGGGTAAAEGELLLGAPATKEMGHADEKDLEGEFQVTIFTECE